MIHAVLPVQLKDRWVALDATLVQEVLGQRPWVPIPGAPPHLPGVIAWRGRAIAVLDLGALADVAPSVTPGEARSRVVIAQVGASAIAVLADAAREVHPIAPGALRPPHATRVRFAIGEIDVGGAVVPVLDLGAAVARAADVPEAA